MLVCMTARAQENLFTRLHTERLDAVERVHDVEYGFNTHVGKVCAEVRCRFTGLRMEHEAPPLSAEPPQSS